ncbi:MAG: transposase [Bacteroidota bacterium]
MVYCNSEHIHLFVSIPPHIPVSECVRRTKVPSSRKIQEALSSIKTGIGAIIFEVAAILVLLVLMYRTKLLMPI